MPVYNVALFVNEAIDSILSQTFKDFELIIIDDNSTDDTCKIIGRYTDKRINFIKKPINTGLIASLNLGINMAKGQYIARMDGDDISYPDRFEKQINFMRSNPEVAVCGAWFQLMATEEIIKYPAKHEDIKLALLEYCPIGHPTVMLRKESIADNQLFYDNDFLSAEDYELWTRISTIGKFANLPETLLSYRQHENQITAKDQTNQVKNSNLCRARMMCRPLAKITEIDIKISILVVSNEDVNNVTKLKEVINWLERLFNLNQQTGFYANPGFKKYIDKNKTRIVRRFYLSRTEYTPKAFYHFIRSYNTFKGCLNMAEQLKFGLKCMLFRKSIPQTGNLG